MTFDRSELLAALEAAAASREPEETPNSATSRELAQALGYSQARTMKVIHEAVGAGLLKAEFVVRRNIQGNAQRIAGYVFIGKE